tara:strand:- start:192 stop:473 length:282 start_codon:yes stop_codon:yes gene_type:complete
MDAKVIVALVVIIAVAAHVVLYRWVKFKIQEGVILQFLRDARLSQARLVGMQPGFAEHGLNPQCGRQIRRTDRRVGRLVPVIDSGLLVAQWNT